MSSYAVRDSTTMFRRNVKRLFRYPAMILFPLAFPVVFLLLFVYVFGGTLGAGLPTGGGRVDYLAYVTPGILLITVAGVPQLTATAVAMDMQQGIVTRFRTMAIFRTSVLSGHALAGAIQALLTLVPVTLLSLALGFRPTANPLRWLAVLGLFALLSLALAWLAVALGLVSKSAENASNLPMVLLLLPFLGSGFVPTDSMPGWLSWFAEHQPFTPFTETIRGLLAGTPVGADWLIALAWCVGIAIVAYVWAKALYNRDPSR